MFLCQMSSLTMVVKNLFHDFEPPRNGKILAYSVSSDNRPEEMYSASRGQVKVLNSFESAAIFRKDFREELIWLCLVLSSTWLNSDGDPLMFLQIIDRSIFCSSHLFALQEMETSVACHAIYISKRVESIDSSISKICMVTFSIDSSLRDGLGILLSL